MRSSRLHKKKSRRQNTFGAGYLA